MGAGLALEFKRRFPLYYRDYAEICELGAFSLGPTAIPGCTWHDNYDPPYPPVIVSVATKQHWRDPSRMAWIVAAFNNLESLIEGQRWPSIAVPALGCGLGGLWWADVRPIAEQVLSGLDCDVRVYEGR